MRAILLTARKKDNPELKKDISKSYLSSKQDETILEDLDNFSKEHPNLRLRAYVSVNTRDTEKTKRALQHALIDDTIDLEKIESKLAGIASKPENSLTKKWLFDCDLEPGKFEDFLVDLENYYKGSYEKYKTPNGFGVIVEHGFDTREILEKYKDVELKRDGLRFLAIYEPARKD